MALNTVLGFDATDAITNLNALVAALNQYNAAIAKSANATKTFNQAGKLAGQAKEVDAAQQSWNNYGKTVSKLSSSHPVMVQQQKLIEKLSKSTKKATQQMILSWKSVIRIFTIQIIHQIISQFTSAIVEATTVSRNFGIAIAETSTVASDMGQTFETLRETAVKTAEAIGQPLSTVAEAQYELYSNQVGNARQSLEVFMAAQKLAVTTVSTLDDSLNLLMGTINAYGFSTAQSEEIAAKYFQTIDVGRVRASELADTMGRITVAGAQLGIEFEELLASIATLTISGVDAAEALTLITNVQLKLIRPTDAMKKAFKELNVETAEAGIQIYGFQGFMEALRDTTQGTATEMGELLGRVRGTRGALGITGAAAEKYNKTLEILRATTKDLLDEKLELIWETNAKQVQLELNKLSVAVTENFGRGMNITLQKIFDSFGGAVGTMKALATVTVAAGSAFLLVKTGALKSLMAIILTAPTAKAALLDLLVTSKALIASPVAWAAAVAIAVTGVIWLYNRATAKVKEHAAAVIEAANIERDAMLKGMELELVEREKKNKEIITKLQKLLHPIVAMEKEAAERAASIEARAFDSLHDQLKERVSSIEGFLASVIKLANGAAAAIRDIERESADVKRTLDAFNFERQIRGLSDQQKIMRLISKSTESRNKASDAIRNNDEKSATALAQQSEDYARQALQIADSQKNSVLTRRAEESVRSALNGQVNLNKQLIQHKKDQAKTAEQSLPDLYAQSNTIKEMVERFSKLKYETTKAKTPEELIKTYEKMATLAAQIDEKTREFQAKFGPLAVKLDLQTAFDEATVQLREGLTGKQMDLSEAVYFDSTQIAKTLQITLNDAQKQVSIKIAAITGVGGARLQQTALTQTPQQLTQARNAEEQRLEALKTTSQAQGNLNALLTAQRSTLIDTMPWYQKLQVLASRAIEPPEQALTFEEKRPDITSANQYIAALSRQTAEMIKQRAPAENIRKNLDALQVAESKIRVKGFKDAADAVKAIHDELLKQAEAQNVLENVAGTLDNLDISIQGAAESVGIMDAAVAAGVPSFVASMEARAAGAEDSARRIIAANAAAAASAGGGKKKSLGGLIYRAAGGAVGTDTVPAMLTPGEFVVNAAATRKFYSQLVAMNSGVKPIFRQEGGPVTTIGDINISVNEAITPQQTAREVMATIRREMRRGTATLR